MKPKVGRRKGTQMRMKSMKQKTKQKTKKIKETRHWFFEKLNKTVNTQVRLIRKKREKTHMTGISSKRCDISIDTKRIRKYEHYDNKSDKLDETDKFLARYK